MENEEQQLSPREEIRFITTNASRYIEEEYSRTTNSWLSCFGSTVFQVETWFYEPDIFDVVSIHEYAVARERLEALKAQLIELKQQFPDREIPSVTLQEELLLKLDIFRKENTPQQSSTQ